MTTKKQFEEIITELIQSTGHASANLMKEAGEYISKANLTKKNIYVEIILKKQENAIPQRIGSCAYLCMLCKPDAKIKKVFLEHELTSVREQAAKALLHTSSVKDIPLIAERLKKEQMFRIKRWLLYALANMKCEKANQAIRNYSPEAELFSDYSKILGEKIPPKNIELESFMGKKIPLIIHTVSGFEDSWLKKYSRKGTCLGNGYIKLEKPEKINTWITHKDCFGIAIPLADYLNNQTNMQEVFPKPLTYKVLYLNKIQKEKSLLSSIMQSLASTGWVFSKDSPLTVQLLNPNQPLLYIECESTRYPFYHPAGINKVVANCIASFVLPESGRVLDPCCGGGTLLIETSNQHPGCQLMGIDKEYNYIQQARRNGKLLNKNISFQKGDGTYTKLGNESVDFILTNPPFGNRIKLGKNRFYEKLIRESKRVLQRKGKLIIYTTQKKQILQEAQRVGFLLEREWKLSLKKIQPSVFVFRKKDPR